MKISTIFKTLLVFTILAVTIAVVSDNVSAQDPYYYGNSIGTYYQWQYFYGFYGRWPETYRTYDGVYSPAIWHYDYVSPPRAGGVFGASTNYLVGLRKPYYPYTYPTLYTSFYRPYCSWPCTFGGYWGYPYTGYFPSDYTYRVRYGYY